MSASRWRRRSFFHISSISSSRPTKYSASRSVNEARPGYGRCASSPVVRSVTSSSARASAAAVGYRCSRSLATALRRTAAHGGVARARRLVVHAAPDCLRAAAVRTPPAATISASTTPAENTSARASTASPRACSGAMYAGVPEIVPTRRLAAARAMPKSMTTTRPARVSITFSGLMSRCTRPAAWIASSPARN